MDSLQPTWRTGLHVYSHWHRATPLDLMVRVPAKTGGECLLWVIADICSAISYVRYTPNSDRESRHARCKRPRVNGTLCAVSLFRCPGHCCRIELLFHAPKLVQQSFEISLTFQLEHI